MVNYDSKKSLGLAGALITAAVAADGCRISGDPYSDLRFRDLPNTFVTTTDRDQESMGKYVANLWAIVDHVDKTKITANDGIGFVVYKLGNEPLPVTKTAEIIHEGMLNGKDISDKRFTGYASLDECLRGLSAEKREVIGEPTITSGTASVTGTAVPTETFKVNVKNYVKSVTYNDKDFVMVVDFKNKRVVGLYNVNDLVAFAPLKAATPLVIPPNNLDTGLFDRSNAAEEGIRKTLIPIMKEEDIEKQLKTVGRATAYLLEAEKDFDAGSLEETSDLFNNGRINEFKLHGLRLAKLSRRSLDKRTGFEQRRPKDFEKKACLEYAVDPNLKAKTRVVVWPQAK